MTLKLVKLEPKYRRHLNDMMSQWYATGEKIVPYAIRRLDYRDFDNYLANLDVKDETEGLVPDSTFFCLDTEQDIFVGAVNIRHRLNDRLLLDGGHIGDGVLPSQRRRGVATRMIALALEECKKLGIERVLMVCDKDNIGSARSIRRNGGVLENEVEVDGVVEQRYWIDLRRQTHYDFFQNRECEYFPCHQGADPETFSCLFCYCPLYTLRVPVYGKRHQGLLCLLKTPPPGELQCHLRKNERGSGTGQTEIKSAPRHFEMPRGCIASGKGERFRRSLSLMRYFSRLSAICEIMAWS